MSEDVTALSLGRSSWLSARFATEYWCGGLTRRRSKQRALLETQHGQITPLAQAPMGVTSTADAVLAAAPPATVQQFLRDWRRALPQAIHKYEHDFDFENHRIISHSYLIVIGAARLGVLFAAEIAFGHCMDDAFNRFRDGLLGEFLVVFDAVRHSHIINTR